MRLRLSRTRYLRIGVEEYVRRSESTAPEGRKRAVELGAREAFDALSARVETNGGTVRCVLLSGTVEGLSDKPHGFTMGEGFESSGDIFAFMIENARAMAEALDVPFHVGTVEGIGGDG